MPSRSNLGFAIVAGIFLRFLTLLHFKEHRNSEPFGKQPVHANQTTAFTIPSVHTNEQVCEV